MVRPTDFVLFCAFSPTGSNTPEGQIESMKTWLCEQPVFFDSLSFAENFGNKIENCEFRANSRAPCQIAGAIGSPAGKSSPASVAPHDRPAVTRFNIGCHAGQTRIIVQGTYAK